MRHHVSPALTHGFVGGLIAATVVALWFFAVDLVAGEPLRTPVRLAGVFLGRELAEPSFRLIATYSVLHAGVFTLLGIATAIILETTDTVPGLLMGVVFGIGVLNTVHYSALLVADASLLTVLPVGHVMLANLAGGMALMAYLHYALHRADPLGLGVLVRYPLIARGVGTGLIGAAAVALWFFLLDLVTARPFYTPAALGSALFLGATSPAQVQVAWGTVAAYTVVHLAAFAAVGILFRWIAERLEQTPRLWLLVLMAFIVLEGLFVATAGTISSWALGAIGWWAIALGNLVAVTAMAGWVLARQPALRSRLLAARVMTSV